MIRSAAVAAALLAAGPALADPAITACEVTLRELVSVPSSFQAMSSAVANDRVAIDFIARNALGVAVRNNALCHFAMERLASNRSISLFRVEIEGRFVEAARVDVLTFEARRNAGVASFRPEQTKLSFPER